MNYRFKTPAIPDWVPAISLPGYINIFGHSVKGRSPHPDPAHRNLWGTETLCGDWNGTVLIVLKDFAPVSFLESRSDGRPPYSHSPTLATNTNLVRLLQSAGVDIDVMGRQNTSCGILYASACFLLKSDTTFSTSISNDALRKSWPVIEFTMAKMPNLSDIVLGGREAYASFASALGNLPDRETLLRSKQPVKWNGYRLHVTSHTAQRGINSRQDGSSRPACEVVEEDWRRVFC